MQQFQPTSAQNPDQPRPTPYIAPNRLVPNARPLWISNNPQVNLTRAQTQLYNEQIRLLSLAQGITPFYSYSPQPVQQALQPEMMGGQQSNRTGSIAQIQQQLRDLLNSGYQFSPYFRQTMGRLIPGSTPLNPSGSNPQPSAPQAPVVVRPCPNPEACIDCLTQKISMKDQLIHDLKAQNQSLQEKLSDSLSSNQKLYESLKARNAEVVDLIFQRDSSRSEASALKSHVASALEAHNSAQEQVKLLTQKVHQYKELLGKQNASPAITHTFELSNIIGTPERGVSLADVSPSLEGANQYLPEIPQFSLPPTIETMAARNKPSPTK